MYGNYQGTRYGLGLDPIAAQSIGTGIAVGGGFATAAVAGTSLAVPVVGAAIAGATLLVGLFLNRKKPAQKVATTQIANEVEGLMKENLLAWKQSDKTIVEQQQALANFDGLWNRFVELTAEDPQMGSPGKQAVVDRKREPQGGDNLPGIDWFAFYRDPIANDTARQLTKAESFLPSSLTKDGNADWGLILPIGIFALVFMID